MVADENQGECDADSETATRIYTLYRYLVLTYIDLRAHDVVCAAHHLHVHVQHNTQIEQRVLLRCAEPSTRVAISESGPANMA